MGTILFIYFGANLYITGRLYSDLKKEEKFKRVYFALFLMFGVIILASVYTWENRRKLARSGWELLLYVSEFVCQAVFYVFVCLVIVAIVLGLIIFLSNV